MLTLKILAFIALAGSASWLVVRPDFEPAIAVVTSFAAVIALFVRQHQQKRREAQEQHVGPGGIGIQAGGDVHVGSSNRPKE
jgi:hypothetical protein